MDKLKVLIVDDSMVYRKILSTAVEGTDIAVPSQTASNGIIALERIEQSDYDIVLLDVNMPELDGIETLKRIKANHPNMQVIMISTVGGKNAEITLKALSLGAIDFIVKPLEADYETNMLFVKNQLKVLFSEVMIKKIHDNKNKETRKVNIPYVEELPKKLEIFNKTKINGVDLVLIASSTGGPTAVETVLKNLGEDFIKPILLVQHMPADFTKIFADTLDKKCNMKVIEGKEDDVIRAGQVIIAPGGYHMVMKEIEHSVKKIGLYKSDMVNGVRPAADVLFKTIAKEYAGARILVIILTGMGCDGRNGLVELKKACKCYCIAQNEETCVVYGMPGSVVEAGLCDEVLPINDIAERIKQIAIGGS